MKLVLGFNFSVAIDEFCFSLHVDVANIVPGVLFFSVLLSMWFVA